MHYFVADRNLQGDLRIVPAQFHTSRPGLVLDLLTAAELRPQLSCLSFRLNKTKSQGCPLEALKEGGIREEQEQKENT